MISLSSVRRVNVLWGLIIITSLLGADRAFARQGTRFVFGKVNKRRLLQTAEAFLGWQLWNGTRTADVATEDAVRAGLESLRKMMKHSVAPPEGAGDFCLLIGEFKFSGSMRGEIREHVRRIGRQFKKQAPGLAQSLRGRVEKASRLHAMLDREPAKLPESSGQRIGFEQRWLRDLEKLDHLVVDGFDVVDRMNDAAGWLDIISSGRVGSYVENLIEEPWDALMNIDNALSMWKAPR